MKPLGNFLVALLFGLAITWAATVALEQYFAFAAQQSAQNGMVENADAPIMPSALR